MWTPRRRRGGRRSYGTTESNTRARRRSPMTVTYARESTLDLRPSPKALDDLRLFTVPEGGTDRLDFITWDTVEVLGMGEDVVELHGHYLIERATPTASDWASAAIDITMLELSVAGVSQMFGPLRASINYDIGKPSRGQVKEGTLYPGVVDSPKMCIMEGFMKFELPSAGVTVFNKDAIVLQHNITHVPPIGQGGGTRGRVAVDLHRVEDPDGPPVAILRQVKTHIGAWKVQGQR
ncbi:MAG: DUF6073 family protein [Actinobacteria bacterium]|nr:DUF6073 family protein [Actinomycetota bacterium]